MRIAHLTDLHLRRHLPGTSILGKRRSREAASVIEHAPRDARERGADVVVVTGDLVDVPPYLLAGQTPSCWDAERWLAAMEADYLLIRTMLADSGLPAIVVPGNHDSYEVAERVFGASPAVREIGGLTFVSFWDEEDQRHVPRRLGRQRELFDRMLAQPRPQVHLQHFVITPELNEDWPHTYAEGEELRRHIVDSGSVRLSLSGHYHPGTDLIRDAGTAFSAGSALVEPPHCYRIYDVDDADADTPVTMQVVPLLADRLRRPAAFVDYAACLTALPANLGELESLRPRDGAAAVLSDLAAAGYLLIALADESWAARARRTPHLVDAVLDRAAELFGDEGAVIDAVYFASTATRTAALRQATAELRLDLESSCLVSSDGVAPMPFAW